MHTVDHAAVVVASLLEQAAVSLTDTASKLKALESRLGMSSTERINPSVPKETIDVGTSQPSTIADEDPVPVMEREPWVWVSGETMPYRQLFRDAGGRWSRRRQAWYWMNASELPEHLRDLRGIEVSVTR